MSLSVLDIIELGTLGTYLYFELQRWHTMILKQLPWSPSPLEIAKKFQRGRSWQMSLVPVSSLQPRNGVARRSRVMMAKTISPLVTGEGQGRDQSVDIIRMFPSEVKYF
jgi:hypothetical protein